MIPNFLSGGVARSISSGGINPTSTVAFAQPNGTMRLVVGNQDSGAVTLLLSGPGTLTDQSTASSNAVPAPTALVLDTLTGTQLTVYIATEGSETVTSLTLSLTRSPPPGTGTGPIPASPPYPPASSGTNLAPSPLTVGATVNVPVLRSLSAESSLAIVATLATVSLTAEETLTTSIQNAVETDSGALGSGAVVLATSGMATGVGAPGGPPNQTLLASGLTRQTGGTGDAAGGVTGPDQAEPPVSGTGAPVAISPLDRFLYGLEDALGKVRIEGQRVPAGPAPRPGQAATSTVDTPLDTEADLGRTGDRAAPAALNPRDAQAASARAEPLATVSLSVAFAAAMITRTTTRPTASRHR